VQETYARWYALPRQQREAIASPGACALPGPIEGGEQVARACAEVARIAPGLTLLERTVNGQPGLIAQQDGVTITVFAFDVAGDRIKHIWAVRNPEKLRLWTAGSPGAD
jgi:hypothetical protein